MFESGVLQIIYIYISNFEYTHKILEGLKHVFQIYNSRNLLFSMNIIRVGTGQE